MSTADSPFRVPMREIARSAARRPIASGASIALRKRPPEAAYSSGRRPSGSCTVTSAPIQKSVPCRSPSKPFVWTSALSERVSETLVETDRIASAPRTARAAVSTASASARRCAAVTVA